MAAALAAQEAGERAAPVLPSVSPVMECGQLAQADFSNVAEAPLKVTSAEAVNDGRPAPYCRVLGYVAPRVQFEVRLPLKGWTQRFLQTGCGGTCGNLNIRVSNANGCAVAQNGELALASTDMGHQGQDPSWGDDPQLRIDFAYRGVHVTAMAAKALMEKFYGRKPRYSYFAGCSDGGREALMEAQRYPEDFNGITAGAPAMNFSTQNTFYHGWNAAVNTDADGKAILTADKLPALHAAVVAACDALDGLKDGLISDPRRCSFDPGTIECEAGKDAATCLSPAQVKVVREFYRGAHDTAGHQLVISGPMPGSELNWRGVLVPNAPGQSAFGAKVATDTLQHEVLEKNPTERLSLKDLHFDRATFDSLKAAHALYDSTDPDLSKFAQAGGKLILWHGWADPHISPLNTIAYYTAVRRAMAAGRAETFARMYLFPGGSHCGGGEGPFDVDLLTPIMNWVEGGKAPAALVASQASKRSRPVFPYPQVAVYQGTGSVDDAGSFAAKMPEKELPGTFDWLGASFFLPKSGR